MASIADLYSLQNTKSNQGIEGYYVEKKYVDPTKIREERILSESKDKSFPSKLVGSKKTTFIDDIQKQSSKLPGPNSYNLQKQKSMTVPVIKHAKRKTFIDETMQLQKKNHFPGAGAYGQIVVEADKKKLKESLSKASSPTYLEACMRNSLESPGVGNYNPHSYFKDKKGTRWVADPEKDKPKKQGPVKLPSVGSYNPNPVSYKLFAGISDKHKRVMSSGFGGKSQRFTNKSSGKQVPFYNVLSEWGMKNKLKKNDILSNISSPTTSRSVYH